MAQLIDTNKRKIIPIWDSFKDSKKENQPLFPTKISKEDISRYKNEWTSNPNIANAADLLTASIVNNQEDDNVVQDAANYILMDDTIPLPLKRISSEIINKGDFNENNIDQYITIANIKKSLQQYPYNAIAHIEMARCYIILGQIDKAAFHVKCALYIDKNNRYVVRCAVRFYVHINNVEKALWVIRRSCLTRKDPWLMASEISLCQILDKSSSNIKRGLSLIESNNYSAFDLTELSSAIGTQELMSGANKKSRKLINISLKSPNNNSLAQARWIISKEPWMNFDFSVVPNIQSEFMEAESYNAFVENDFEKSLEYAQKWIVQEPYSTRSILYAFNIALNFARDLSISQQIMRDAIKVHKNNLYIVNDYVYSLALDNKIDEAEKILNKRPVNKSSDEIKDICFTATVGLVFFRKGKFEEGTECYISAIKRSLKHKNNPEINHSAILSRSLSIT